MAQGRDELGDYLDGRATGWGGDSVGGAMGRAAHYADLEARRRARPPATEAETYAVVRAALAFLVYLAVRPALQAVLPPGTVPWVGLAVGLTAFLALNWGPVAYVVKLAVSGFALVCMILIGASLLDLEGGVLIPLDALVRAVAEPVLALLGTF